jgi:hypothetical protein
VFGSAITVFAGMWTKTPSARNAVASAVKGFASTLA